MVSGVHKGFSGSPRRIFKCLYTFIKKIDFGKKLSIYRNFVVVVLKQFYPAFLYFVTIRVEIIGLFRRTKDSEKKIFISVMGPRAYGIPLRGQTLEPPI